MIERGMFRSRRLLDLAHRVEKCTNCGGERREGSEPAHSNEGAHGKGHKLKSHDCFFAALCHACHAWYDNRAGYGMDPTKRYTWAERGEMFRRAMDATLLVFWRAGWLKVA